MGFATSVFEMVQELGRCGRGRTHDFNTVTDNFHLFLTLDDFVYLNQRLYFPQPPIPRNVTQILSIEDKRKTKQKSILDLEKMIVL